MLFNILVISIALSIDALGIGISYRLKGVKISCLAKSIIGILSGFIMLGSLFMGKVMLKIVPNEVAQIFGTVVLLMIGLSFIRNSLFQKNGKTYDFDQSKEIELGEAAILGVALSADSISAGVAISTIGLSSFWIPIVVGFMQVILLYLGELFVEKCNFFKEKTQSKACGVFAGALLILMAILRGIK